MTVLTYFIHDLKSLNAVIPHLRKQGIEEIELDIIVFNKIRGLMPVEVRDWYSWNVCMNMRNSSFHYKGIKIKCI